MVVADLAVGGSHSGDPALGVANKAGQHTAVRINDRRFVDPHPSAIGELDSARAPLRVEFINHAAGRGDDVRHALEERAGGMVRQAGLQFVVLGAGLLQECVNGGKFVIVARVGFPARPEGDQSPGHGHLRAEGEANPLTARRGEIGPRAVSHWFEHAVLLAAIDRHIGFELEIGKIPSPAIAEAVAYGRPARVVKPRQIDRVIAHGNREIGLRALIASEQSAGDFELSFRHGNALVDIDRRESQSVETAGQRGGIQQIHLLIANVGLTGRQFLKLIGSGS